jgi:formate dehydrogenase subunit gamma
MSFVPGLGIAKGLALTLRRFFQPRATIQYPETAPDVAVRFRGRLQLLYDEWGALKCETCFQCAQACPVECIDMGGHDTRNRFWTHWGPAETYAERREESALRRSGRPVPDPAFVHFHPIDMVALEEILERHDYDPNPLLPILEEVQAAYGYLPVAALKHISHTTGAYYAYIYGTASYYDHLSFQPKDRRIAVCHCTGCLLAGAGRIAATIASTLSLEPDGSAAGGFALERVSSHVPGAASPLVELDGRPVSVTAKGARAWAEELAIPGRGAAGRGAAPARGRRARTDA